MDRNKPLLIALYTSFIISSSRVNVAFLTIEITSFAS